ncbi:hypothetical protein [Corynebacterium sp. 321]|uniref:hypothetical protein n=1 Tax=Corynebacterium sp. 321 TaxID=2651047 RepID=UPI0013018066|nr:hypothetical protein [Corynebacterium sp. 321]KAB1550678.1 hypothetical protein F7233_09065 [Corynebacterium sp. 321]
MLLLLNCGAAAQQRHARLAPSLPSDAEVRDTAEIPTRSELKFLDSFPERFVVGSTPSLDEIAAQPDVAHLGAPQPDPHTVSEPVRIVVSGTDAALSAVVTKLMRIDALWVEVAYLPVQDSDVARAWGIDVDASEEALADQVRTLVTAPATPHPVIRDDHGLVTLAKAQITGPLNADGEAAELIGEVIVDSTTIYNHLGTQGAKGAEGASAYGPAHDLEGFNNGVTMVPTATAPGLVATPRKPLSPRVSWSRLFSSLSARARAERAQPTVTSGRALQAGGVDMQVTRDGVPHPRPLTSVTFYRHLRDGQFVTFNR